jgi:steroid delta-isomerase-like uncharacterized protein
MRRWFLLVLWVVGSCVFVYATDTHNEMIAKEVFTRIFAAGETSLVDQLYTPNYHDNYPGTDTPGPYGREFVKEAAKGWKAAFPDLAITFNNVVSDGDKVVVHWTATGTQKGPLGDLPATDRRASIPGITIFRFENGKIAEEWTVFDRANLMHQLTL